MKEHDGVELTDDVVRSLDAFVVNDAGLREVTDASKNDFDVILHQGLKVVYARSDTTTSHSLDYSRQLPTRYLVDATALTKLGIMSSASPV